MFDSNIWKDRIISADRYFKEWETLFRCKKLDNYYEGFHWNIQSSDYLPYTLNMMYSTIKVKLANILYQNPEFEISPFPNKMDWDIENAVQTAYLKQDALNTLVRNPNSFFAHNAKLAALDSFTRFGMIEVGYAADWFNPAIIKPLDLKEEDVKEQSDFEKENEVPENERIFFQHIKASTFRCSIDEATNLEQTSWCGYYKFINRSILQEMPGIEFPKDYKFSYYAADFPSIASYFGTATSSPEFYNYLGRGEVCKVWFIWDNYHKKKQLLLDGRFDSIFEDDYERIPLKDLRWDFRSPSKEGVGFYPVPLAWQWISPQDEINRAREQMRRYRRRYTRKFGYVKGLIESEELEKFISDRDGEVIEFKQPNAIFPISNPEIGATIQIELGQSINDLNTVSGVTNSARGQPSEATATATRIADVREQIRESVEQLDFSAFLTSVGREGLLIFQERFSTGMWIKYTADNYEEFLGEIQEKNVAFKYVRAQDINDGYDMDISINLINSTPARMIEEEQKFLKFLTIVNQYPQISLSPILIREAAYRSGYRNERVIKEMQKTALLNMLGSAAQMGGDLSGAGGGMGLEGINQNNIARQTNQGTSTLDEIRNQLASQLS